MINDLLLYDVSEDWYSIKKVGAPIEWCIYGVAIYNDKGEMKGFRVKESALREDDDTEWYVYYKISIVQSYQPLSEQEVFALRLAGKI